MEHIFSGKWISAPMSVEDRFAPIFKKEFSVSNAKSVKIVICGLGLFELKINGILPDDTVLNPAHSQYNETVYYRIFDVTDNIANGKFFFEYRSKSVFNAHRSAYPFAAENTFHI